MKLVKPSFEILGEIDGMKVLKSIEAAGRTCYKSEAKITEDSAIKFVQNVIKRGHESVIEHEKVTVRIICDRGVSHEIVRHRIASYSQESTRYCDYAGGHITFIIPSWLNIPAALYDYESINSEFMSSAEVYWLSSMLTIEHNYKELRNLGWKPEQARSILPNSLKTEIVVTMNLREWRHFFRLRTAPAAHPQMREVSIPMLAKFKELIPVVFDDINPEVSNEKTT
jgi:thymidylate synthase (FAD)